MTLVDSLNKRVNFLKAVCNELDLDEMLDEWGREYFAEGRRRIDLIRYDKFHDAWWDKTADSDEHTSIFPLMRNVLNTNDQLVQNDGYNK